MATVTLVTGVPLDTFTGCDYAAAVSAAADHLVSARLLLPEDAEAHVARARANDPLK